MTLCRSSSADVMSQQQGEGRRPQRGSDDYSKSGGQLPTDSGAQAVADGSSASTSKLGRYQQRLRSPLGEQRRRGRARHMTCAPLLSFYDTARRSFGLYHIDLFVISLILYPRVLYAEFTRRPWRHVTCVRWILL
jgi:hypothetical protein